MPTGMEDDDLTAPLRCMQLRWPAIAPLGQNPQVGHADQRFALVAACLRAPGSPATLAMPTTAPAALARIFRVNRFRPRMSPTDEHHGDVLDVDEGRHIPGRNGRDHHLRETRRAKPASRAVQLRRALQCRRSPRIAACTLALGDARHKSGSQSPPATMIGESRFPGSGSAADRLQQWCHRAAATSSRVTSTAVRSEPARPPPRSMQQRLCHPDASDLFPRCSGPRPPFVSRVARNDDDLACSCRSIPCRQNAALANSCGRRVRTARSIGIRSVDEPVQKPWPARVVQHVLGVLSGVSIAAPWAMRITSGYRLPNHVVQASSVRASPSRRWSLPLS